MAERAVDRPPEPGPPAANTAGSAGSAGSAEERFWRKGTGAADTGTLPPMPPEPGSTPAELEEAGDVEAEPVPDPAESP